ncbi:MAG: hypothetical protein U0903_01035 [Planctomycetales bacterium]
MKQILKKGSTSKRMAVFIADSSSTTGAGLTGLTYNASGLAWYYWREDAGNNGGTQVTLATATRGTWTSGGFKEVDATNLPGWYEIGIPDAVLASGAYWAVMLLKGATNMAPLPIEIQLVTYDPTDANLGLTGLAGLTAPTAGALPTVGSGTNQLALSNGVAQADLRKVLGTAVTESSAGQLAGGYTHFFDVASPTGTVNSLPSAAADTNGGLIVIGTGIRQLNPNAGGVSIAFNGRQQIWEFLTSDISATGSIGKQIIDALDAAVSTRAAAATALSTADWTNGRAAKLDHLDADVSSVSGGGSAPSAATVAAAVWDQDRSGHATTGSFGEFLDAAVSSRLADSDFVAYSPTDINTALSAAHGSGSWEQQDVSGLALEASVQSVKARTDLIPDEPAAVGSTMALPANGISSATIANGALTDAKFAVPSVGTGPATGVLGRLDQLWRFFFSKVTLAEGELTLFAEDGTSVLTTQSVQDDGTTQTRGAAV